MFDSVVILNGPSSLAWQRFRIELETYGCNLAYEDFRLDHCVIVDIEAIKNLRHRSRPEHTRFYTKTSCPDNLLWPGLERIPIPGIDSGTAACDLALKRTQGWVLVIGADGQFGQTETRYQYAWQRRQPTERVYSIHYQTWLKLHSSHRVIFCSEQRHPVFLTLGFEGCLNLVCPGQNK